MIYDTLSHRWGERTAKRQTVMNMEAKQSKENVMNKWGSAKHKITT
jgi:hypothetical protein